MEKTAGLEPLCRSFLLYAQAQDGGWGYRPDSSSNVEATAWALLALPREPELQECGEACERGVTWLRQAQLPDGSWPAYRQQPEGCWATSLACLALQVQAQAEEAVARGLAWLCHTWPGEGGWWWRLQERLFGSSTVLRQNLRLRGWSWTPRTASWVEPTAYALILFRSVPGKLLPRTAARRRQLGRAMLYDRMCPGGGWNCGNPVVYGVPGEAQVGPTVWALLALQDDRERRENRDSLEWLRRTYRQIQGPGSLALAHLCLEIYAQPLPSIESRLQELYSRNQFFMNVAVAAWVALALQGPPGWLGGPAPEGNGGR